MSDAGADLRALLTRHNGNVSAAARELGLTRLVFYRHMQKLGVAEWNTQTHGIAHRHARSVTEDAMVRLRVHVDGARSALTALRGTEHEQEAISLLSALLAGS